jgi:serine/threonine protein kinase
MQVEHLVIWVSKLIIDILYYIIAPEVLNLKQHGYAVDYWALGVIIYELMFEKRPYGGLYRKDYKEQLCNTFVQVKHGEQPEGWSTECVDIVNGLLQRKEELRLGYNDINKIKSHPWFSDINWKMLLNHELVAPFIPVSNEDFYDPNYLLSFEITDQLKQDIKVLQENILNPNLQKQFNGFYYDKHKVNRRHRQNRRSFEYKNINNKS